MTIAPGGCQSALLTAAECGSLAGALKCLCSLGSSCAFLGVNIGSYFRIERKNIGRRKRNCRMFLVDFKEYI